MHARAAYSFHPFEVRASSKSYIVYTKTPEQKNKWIQQINESVAVSSGDGACVGVIRDGGVRARVASLLRAKCA